MDKSYDILYVDENYELKKYRCHCSFGLTTIKGVFDNLPDEIKVESIICIKVSSWKDVV